MGAFEDAQSVEARGLGELLPFLRTSLASEGQFVLTGKGRLSPMLQKSVGDALVNSADGDVWGIDFKIEEGDYYGNFYLEEWSNLSRFTPGWMFTSRTDLIWYYFLDSHTLYSISLERLRRWAFRQVTGRGADNVGRIWDFPLRRQRKRDQLNDTWGRCVPIEVVRQEVGFREYDLASTEVADGQAQPAI